MTDLRTVRRHIKLLAVNIGCVAIYIIIVITINDDVIARGGGRGCGSLIAVLAITIALIRKLFGTSAVCGQLLRLAA